MIRRFSVNFAVFSMAMDAGIVALNLWLAGHLRPLLGKWLLGFPAIRHVSAPIPLPLPLYLATPVIWVLIMALFSVYDGRKNLRIVDEFTSLTLSAIVGSISLAGFLYLTYRDVSRLLFLSFVVLTYTGLLVWRIPARLWYRRRASRLGRKRRVLIAGAGWVGKEVEEHLQKHAPKIEVIGFLDDDPEKRRREPRIWGPLDDARPIIKHQRVTDVIIALPLRAHKRMDQLIWALFDLPVRIHIVPDYFQWTLHHAEMEEIAQIPMLDVRAPALSEGQRIVKRLFDLAITLLLFIPSLPVMAVIAVLLWLDDGFPVFFPQKRVGENGRIFTMYKFRTMVKHSEEIRHLVERVDEQGNLIHKSPDDPRVTRLGRFLRRTSLDELPQLFNVLRGDMSLVGPRPELPYLVEKYQPWQRKRFAVPQGITGWWQIHGRSDKPMHLHTEDDLYYIQHYSIWLDIQILIKTLWIVLRGRGAY